MLDIKIKEIRLKNFKCYESAAFKFNDATTTIKGITGCGKTTIKDAYLWCLGFDCNFAPKINDMLVKDIDTVVEVTLSLGGITTTLKRINKQKWKYSGEKEVNEFVGNDSKFEIGGVSKTATTYKQMVAELFNLQSHQDVRLVTDLSAFNNDAGTKWTWKERRTYLFNTINIDKKVSAIAKKKAYEHIQEALLSGKDEIEISKIIALDERLVYEKQKGIKSEIEKNNQFIAELSRRNWSYMESELARLEQDLSDLVDKQIEQKTDIKTEIAQIEYQLPITKSQIKAYQEEIERLQKTSASIFNQQLADKCPTCGRKFAKDKIVKLKASFELDKFRQMAEIENEDENYRKNVEGLQIQVSHQEQRLQALKAQISPNFNGISTNSQLQNEIDNTRLAIKDLERQLAEKSLIENYKENNDKLKADLKVLLNTQKNIVAKKLALKKFVEEKIAVANKELEKVFGTVRFKFYKYNTANAENEYMPTCECLLDGVAYQNLSQGQKIIADFDTNNGLQKLLGINAPQFIDNKQNNTFEMASENQKIELVTCNESNINATFVRDVYTENDCNIKGE